MHLVLSVCYIMCFCELIFLCTDSDDEEEDEDVKTAFKPQVILEPKVGLL